MENLPIEIRKQLGYIIRENRLVKLKESRKQGLLINPYTKSNFCENNKVCHYNTLSTLENDYITNTKVYYMLLSKLGLSFKVSIKKHNEDMKMIEKIIYELLKAVEYLNIETIENIKIKLDSINFNDDCITQVFYKLILFHYNLFLVKKIEDKDVEELQIYKAFFIGLPKGLLHHSLGTYYLNTKNLDEAEKCFIIADKVYEKYKVSVGVIKTCFISLYFVKHRYLELLNLCIEMELFFNETKNYKRLIYTYSYLSKYYFLINAKNLAFENYYKTINFIDSYSYLSRFEFSIHYNMGLFCIKEILIKEAYNFMNLAYAKSNNDSEKFKSINILLFLNSKLKNNEMNNKFLDEGKDCLMHGNSIDQITFKYFKYKHEKNMYYRKYAIENVLPVLKSDPTRIDFALLLYEDLYEL